LCDADWQYHVVWFRNLSLLSFGEEAEEDEEITKQSNVKMIGSYLADFPSVSFSLPFSLFSFQSYVHFNHFFFTWSVV
jgi:hypothetical protein